MRAWFRSAFIYFIKCRFILILILILILIVIVIFIFPFIFLFLSHGFGFGFGGHSGGSDLQQRLNNDR